MDETLHCPTCGAPLRIQSRFVKVVACEFCGGVSLYDGATLDPTGRTAGLVDLPSPLYLDATGRLEGRPFRVVGRLVYEYDGGRWHEWFLTFDDERPGWLVEDEGRFTLLQKGPAPDAPPYAHVAVGQLLRVGGREVFVTEKGEAAILGGEGQLGFPLLPGERVGYVDGTAGEEEVGLEYGAAEVELFIGRTVAPEAVRVDEEVY